MAILNDDAKKWWNYLDTVERYRMLKKYNFKRAEDKCINAMYRCEFNPSESL